MPEQDKQLRPVLRYEFEHYQKDTGKEIGYIKRREKEHTDTIGKMERAIIDLEYKTSTMQHVLDELEKQVQGPRKLIMSAVTTAIIAGAVSLAYSLL